MQRATGATYRIARAPRHFGGRAVAATIRVVPDDSSQIFIPPSFIALFVPEGRLKPVASRDEITRRYEFCEALATMLVDRALELQWRLGITEDDVLERMAEGLDGGESGVSMAEAKWIARRLAELLDSQRPVRRG